jgi:branched-chain amino acid transport system substrate-binding protein
VVKAMNDTEFDTVIGKFKFNEKGDPNLPPYAVYRWSNGNYSRSAPRQQIVIRTSQRW